MCKKGNGWAIPKFHAISKYPYYIKQFGSSCYLNKGIGESNLKKFVKKPSHNTQKRASNFTKQIADRYHETSIQEVIYESVKDHCCDFFPHPCLGLDEHHKFEGQYTLKFSEPIDGSRTTNLRWRSKGRQQARSRVSEDMIRVLMSYAEGLGHLSQFEIKGYTFMKLNKGGEQIIYRSTTDFLNNDWFDFCLMEYLDNDVTKFAPAKILGIVKFFDDIFIPHGSTTDDTFVVVHTGDFIDPDILTSKFVTSFTLGDGKKYWEVHSCNSIAHPLLAVPVYGGENTSVYWTSCPYLNWGNNFRKKMNV